MIYIVVNRSTNPDRNFRSNIITCHYLLLPMSQSLSLMSAVDFQKGPCCRVKFRGRGPYDIEVTMPVSREK